MPRAKPAPPHAPDALDQLRELVQADGRPIRQIAEEGGLLREHLYAVLSGDRADPRFSTIARILAALGRNWDDLISD
jgi:DNA-binding phage protein